MNKLMMTVASLALIGFASPVLAQSSSNGPISTPSASAPSSSAPSATSAPDMTAPNNSSTNMPQDTAPMSSKDSTSAVSPAQGATQSSSDAASTDQKPMHKASHRSHPMKPMGSTKVSGSKSTDHDAEQLNQQELGKLQSPN